jgi:hypothetical protein
MLYLSIGTARMTGFTMCPREKCAAADKAIVYLNGFLFALDRKAKIAIPVSRCKLAEIGLGCVLAALKGKGAAARSVEPVPAKPPREALLEPPPEATESPEA